ncbi:MAG: NblA/ycf18 family protein [Cyanobacteria bacterium P01_F01_bin.150]
MSIPGNLSLEQRFRLQMMQSQVKSLDLEQAQEYVVELLRQMMVKDNLVKELLHSK